METFEKELISGVVIAQLELPTVTLRSLKTLNTYSFFTEIQYRLRFSGP